jgi:DNA repair ATPase RecN
VKSMVEEAVEYQRLAEIEEEVNRLLNKFDKISKIVDALLSSASNLQKLARKIDNDIYEVLSIIDYAQDLLVDLETS